MAILFRNRATSKARLKSAIARMSADKNSPRVCPRCSTAMRVSNAGKDRVEYFCDKCNNTATFTVGPRSTAPMENTTQMGSITLRDRSTTKGYKRNDPDYRPTRDVTASLDVLRDSMKKKVVVSFQYTAVDGTTSVRSVEPYKLTLQGGAPVLYAYDIDVGSIRVFKLESVDAIESQTFTFKPRWSMEDKLSKESKDAPTV